MRVGLVAPGLDPPVRRAPWSVAFRLATHALFALIAGAVFAGSVSGEAPGDREGLRSGPRAKRDRLIPLVPWSDRAFDRSREDCKLVLLNLTASWSHWCHIMDETSYSDDNIIVLLRRHYVPIRVEGDRRPDVRDRYLAGGWPTTAILTPDGLAIVSRTYVDPRALRRMLAETRQVYGRTRLAVAEREKAERKRILGLWQSRPPDFSLLEPEALASYVDHVAATELKAEDPEHGGFGPAPRTPGHDTIALLLALGAARGDSAFTRAALRSVDASQVLEDSIDGGFHRFALDSDWSRVRFEKPLDVNARVIATMAEAYRLTRRPEYRSAIRRTADYVARTLWDERGERFYGGQDADVGSHDSSGTFLSGDVYYTLSRQGRRAAGAPAADSTYYADMNARAASSLLRAVASDALDQAEARRALRVIDRIWTEHRLGSGRLLHAIPAGRVTGERPSAGSGTAGSETAVSGLLLDAAPLATACLDAYEFSGSTRYRDRARILADWIRADLEDSVGGGFRYAPRDTTAVGRLAAGDKPRVENIEAATVFLRLHWLEGAAADRITAERAFAYLRETPMPGQEPALALLAHRLRSGPVRFAAKR